MKKINYPKAIFAAVLAVYGIILASDPSEYRFLDRVDLVIHEAGHMLFRWFGEFLMVIGGTLGQLLVPAGIAAYFFLRRERFSSAAAAFWVGQNFLNISNYVKDAQAMDMPLVSIGGGSDTIHDWNYLLLKFNVLRHDQAIGSFFVAIGVLVILASVIAAFFFSLDREAEE